MIALIHGWIARVTAEKTPEQHLQDLILREQKPLKWASRHPLKAVERLFR